MFVRKVRVDSVTKNKWVYYIMRVSLMNIDPIERDLKLLSMRFWI